MDPGDTGEQQRETERKIERIGRRGSGFIHEILYLVGFRRKLVPTGRETMRNIFHDCIPVGGQLIVSFKAALHAASERSLAREQLRHTCPLSLFCFFPLESMIRLFCRSLCQEKIELSNSFVIFQRTAFPSPEGVHFAPVSQLSAAITHDK